MPFLCIWRGAPAICGIKPPVRRFSASCAASFVGVSFSRAKSDLPNLYQPDAQSRKQRPIIVPQITQKASHLFVQGSGSSAPSTAIYTSNDSSQGVPVGNKLSSSNPSAEIKATYFHIYPMTSKCAAPPLNFLIFPRRVIVRFLREHARAKQFTQLNFIPLKLRSRRAKIKISIIIHPMLFKNASQKARLHFPGGKAIHFLPLTPKSIRISAFYREANDKRLARIAYSFSQPSRGSTSVCTALIR